MTPGQDFISTERIAFFENAEAPANFTLRALVGGIGSAIRVFADPNYFDETLFQEMTSAWPVFDGPGTNPELIHDRSLSLITLGICNATNYAAVASEFSTVVTRAALHSLRHTERVLLHAGGVADESGGVGVVVGPSGRGKTTTVRALAQTYAYVSDESIAISRDGRVLPYPKPLSLIVPEEKHKKQIPSQQLGMKQLESEALYLKSIAFLERGSEGTPGYVEPLPLAEALTQICSQSSYLVELESPLASVARLMNFVGGFKRLVAGSADSLESLADVLWTRYPAQSWANALPQGEIPSFGDDRLVDAISTDDGVLILTADRQLHHLSPIASAVWMSLCEGTGISEISEEMVAKFGRPETGSALDAVTGILDELRTLGVIENLARFVETDGNQK